MASQYRNILKATSIFGGTQLIQILVGLIRSKFVAILIGTTGMGLSSVYMSSLTMFITIFGLGANMSVVKDLSRAYDQQDWHRYNEIVITFRHILFIVGIAGTLFVILLSPFLSRWAFGNYNYVIQYCFLSVIVFFTLYSQGNTAVLISSRKIKDTAKSSLYSSIASLLLSVPFFYFYGLDGVVPGLICSAIGNYVITFLFARKIKIEQKIIPRIRQIQIAKGLIGLGLAMVIASLTGNVSTYLVNIIISNLGGMSDLGLYTAGCGITVQVVAMVFASMSSDYSPRLSAAMGDKDRMNQTMNQQSEVLLLITVPLLASFMIVSPFVIRILLSEDFMPINGFIRVICLGMVIKAASYALGYASFAKGDKKVYLFVEGGLGNFVYILFSIIFYYYWGLNGLAWAFVGQHVLYYAYIYIIDCKRYGYEMSKDVLYLLILSGASFLCLLALSYIMPDRLYYCLGGLFAFAICYYYFRRLNSKTNFINELLCLIKA